MPTILQTINSNCQIYNPNSPPVTSEPPYPAGLKIEQQKTVQMIERHEHDAEAHAKRVMCVSKDGLPIDENNRLPVEALLEASQISIGAVTIKDQNSNTQADVENVGLNALVVTFAETILKTKVVQFGASVVGPGATVTLISYTVPALKTFHWVGAFVGGRESGEFTLQINGATVVLIRNSGSIRTINSKFPEDPEASGSSVVEIKVKNISELSRSFEATLFGYTL